MKKKLLMLLLALSCTLSVVACSKGEENTVKDAFADEDEDDKDEEKKKEKESETETVVETEEETEEETKAEKREPAVAPADLSDELFDFQVSINGTVYQFPIWYSDFEAMGWEYLGDTTMTLASNEYTFSDEWEKDGLTISTRQVNMSMNTVDMTETIVGGISFDKWTMKDSDAELIFPGGIQYGVSTTEDILAAYGEPTSDYDGDLYYQLDYNFDYMQKVSFYVYHDTGVLEEVDLQNFVELEGLDNTVDATVPDAVKEYNTPKELGDDYYSYNFEVYGDLYTLPCPVSVFLENGYTINEDRTNMEIGAGSYGWITLERGDDTIYTSIDNLADYATIAENCFVTSMSTSAAYDEETLIFPGNITVGSSEADVLKAIDGFNYDVTESDGYTYYEIYAPDKSFIDCYEIVINGGEVISLYIDNDDLPE